MFLDGILSIEPWGGVTAPAYISLGEDATLSVMGDFIVGPGVHISVNSRAILQVGGKHTSSGSGITANARIMVDQSVSIGKDCIIAWDTFITDSNWHDISGEQRSSPTEIGDDVWISHGVSVLKGSNIPRGCIVAAKAVVSRGHFEENSLIGGLPAHTLKKGVFWTR